MRLITATFALALVGLITSPVLAEDITKQAADAAKEWNAAFNKQDAKTLAGYYSKDAMLLPPAETTVTGTDDIQKFWQSLFDGGFKDHTVETIAAEAEGDYAYHTGTWSAKGGDGKTYRGRVVKILEKEGGAWKTKVHTWNMIE